MTSKLIPSTEESASTSQETTHLTTFTNEISLSTSSTEKLNSTFTTLYNTFSITNNQSLFEDFCLQTVKNLDCSSIGGKVELTDAFYGISSEMPPVCAYK